MKKMEELIDSTLDAADIVHKFYQELIKQQVPMSILYIATHINLKKLDKHLRLDYRADDETMRKMDMIAQDLFEGMIEAYDDKVKNLT